jgi:hypothetical protein
LCCITRRPCTLYRRTEGPKSTQNLMKQGFSCRFFLKPRIQKTRSSLLLQSKTLTSPQIKDTFPTNIFLYTKILSWRFPLRVNKGINSETGFYYGMERNFVCTWRRPNCRSQVKISPCLRWSLDYEINIGFFKQFLFTCNNFYIVIIR